MCLLVDKCVLFEDRVTLEFMISWEHLTCVKWGKALFRIIIYRYFSSSRYPHLTGFGNDVDVYKIIPLSISCSTVWEGFLQTRRSLINILAKLEELEYRVIYRLQKWNYILYTLVTCKVRYFKHLFVVILIRLWFTAYENPSQKLQYCEQVFITWCDNHHNYIYIYIYIFPMLYQVNKASHMKRKK